MIKLFSYIETSKKIEYYWLISIAAELNTVDAKDSTSL